MSEVRIRLSFNRHPCTNMSSHDFHIGDDTCDCRQCRCDDYGVCCGEERSSAFCPDCGDEVENPHCHQCNGNECECGELFREGVDVLYTGTVDAEWRNGELYEYTGSGHPHLTGGTYCLGFAAEKFENVTTKEQALEAVFTHISNVDFHGGLDDSGESYEGIEVKR